MSILCSAAAFLVAAAYYVWRAGVEARRRRQSLLSRRVAYMLWVMAEGDDLAVPWGPSWPPAEDCGYE